MGWKQNWVYVNLQVPPALDEYMKDYARRTGTTRPDQIRRALMQFHNISDLTAPVIPAVVLDVGNDTIEVDAATNGAGNCK